MARAPFIVFEGIDGSGTTTQAEALKNWLEDRSDRRVFLTREPSDGPVGALIKQALRKRITFDPRVLALLFAADRIDHLDFEIQKRLDEGVTVLCDRYYLSSFAYQMVGTPEDLEWLEQLNARAIPPDLTILIDVPADVVMKRIETGRWQTELFEKLEYQKAVRENYLTLARGSRSEKERIVVVDGNRSQDEVFEDICSIVRDQFEDGA
tara:strand:+ start:22 stop:648 length:627 start_codon:yes stop_codon:yes gene_type:complete